LLAISARAADAVVRRDVDSVTADEVVGLVLARRGAVADDALKSIAGGSDDEARPPQGLDSATRGVRQCSADLPSRAAGAGGDDRAAVDWFGLQVRWCVSQCRC